MNIPKNAENPIQLPELKKGDYFFSKSLGIVRLGEPFNNYSYWIDWKGGMTCLNAIEMEPISSSSETGIQITKAFTTAELLYTNLSNCGITWSHDNPEYFKRTIAENIIWYNYTIKQNIIDMLNDSII